MVVVSYSGKEINAKVVYYGPGLCGKTTNLEYIYGAVPNDSRGKMVSMKTRTERTLFFDFLPVDLGSLGGFKTRFLLYTVPGQVYYNATRKLVLRGVDALVFVADSGRGKMKDNIESLQNLRDNLKDYDMDLDDMPWVLQYNKRDLDDVYSIEELEKELNTTGVPYYESVAMTGEGVFECFRGIGKLLLNKLSKEVKLDAQPAKPDSNILDDKPAGKAAPAAPAAATPAPAAPKAQAKAEPPKQSKKKKGVSAAKPAASKPAPTSEAPAQPSAPAPAPAEPVQAASAPIDPKSIPVSIQPAAYQDEDESDKPGFLGRLFGRGKKQQKSEPESQIQRVDIPPAVSADDSKKESAPAAGGPVMIEKKIQVPISLNADEVARGVTLRLVLDVQVDSNAQKSEAA